MTKSHVRALAILIGVNALLVIGSLANANNGAWPPERSAIIELAGSLAAGAGFCFFATFNSKSTNVA
jgi:hypothetical protein